MTLSTHGRRLLGLATVTAVTAGTWAFGQAAPASAEPRSDVPGVKVSEVQLTKKRERVRAGTASRNGSADRNDTGNTTTVVAELPARTVSSFSTVGVTWSQASPDVTVEVKTRSGGSWSDWTALGDSVDETASGQERSANTRAGTDPVWVGASDAVAVRVLGSAESTITDPQLALVSTPQTSSDARAAAAAVATAPGLAAKPSVVSRAGWGADESWRRINSGCATPRIDQTIKAAIVHHTAGANSYTAAQSASIVRGIYAYHVKSQGWCDIGYNFLVDKYGKIFEGRAGGTDLPVHGAHATSWNTNTVGVSMMGNYDTVRPPAAMLESVARVIAWKFDGNYVDPRGKVTLAGKYINRIAGHRDVMQTSCPGRYGYAALPGIRTRVAELEGSWKTPIWSRWQALGADAGPAGSPYVGERVVADGRWTQFGTYDMFSSVDTGAFFTAGPIRTRYRALGTATSKLGFPITDTVPGAVAGSQQNLFEKGAIMYSPATGAQEIYGGIWRTYKAIPSVERHLALPVAPEYKLASAGGVPVQDFQKGRVYWISSSGRAVYGSIWKEYKRLGAESSVLGRPVGSEETGPTNGSRQSRFESGIILYSGSTGARAVSGSVYTKWRGLSAANKSRLGLPTGNQVSSGSRVQQSFQYGEITATASGATVTYRR